MRAAWNWLIPGVQKWQMMANFESVSNLVPHVLNVSKMVRSLSFFSDSANRSWRLVLFFSLRVVACAIPVDIFKKPRGTQIGISSLDLLLNMSFESINLWFSKIDFWLVHTSPKLSLMRDKCIAFDEHFQSLVFQQCLTSFFLIF